MRLSQAQVLELEKVASGSYYMLLREPYIAERALPGQFVHIRVREGLYPFLRRPFSVAGTFPLAGTWQILFRVVGEGTRILSSLSRGSYLDCLGPLGSNFKTSRELKPSVLIGGGIGIAPLVFLAHYLVSIERKPIVLLYGAKTYSEMVPLERFLPQEVDVVLATEDGSVGTRGLVTEIFEERVNGGLSPGEIFACGPRPMLRILAEMNKKWHFPLQLSLEERMACGVGACLGCAVEVMGEEGPHYLRVCREGPVFRDNEVVWADGRS